jgi:hypothetical protein
MKKNIPIIIGFLICIVVMGVSYMWATRLMDSVYAYRSPLRNSPPKQGEALGVPNTRSLVIVLVDALRYDTSQKSDVMPFLNQLKDEGASALMHSRPPSYSEPSYTVILTGAWPDLSDGPVINLDYADIPTFTQDNIYSAAHRAGLLTADSTTSSCSEFLYSRGRPSSGSTGYGCSSAVVEGREVPINVSSSGSD